MKFFIVLTFFAPLVLCRISYNVDIELKYDDIKEIYALKTLTETLTELKQPYKSPLESSLTLSNEDVCFYVYTREDKQGKKVLVEEAGSITSHSSFKTNLKTVFIIHGWHNDYHSPMDELIEAALMGLGDMNVIAVNWDDIAKSIYSVAFAAVPKIGKRVGEFITTLTASYDYSMDNIWIVGHSLGAHIGGFAGKATNGNLALIVGLDPAGPLYFEALRNERLNEDDAKYVLAIHTCAKLLGVNYPVGNSDFWPNGGHSQAGCGIDLAGTCAHGRSYYYFIESMTSNNFIARQCDSYHHYQDGKCKQNPKGVISGSHVDVTLSGNYYLNTNEQSPYAQGDTDH